VRKVDAIVVRALSLSTEDFLIKLSEQLREDAASLYTFTCADNASAEYMKRLIFDQGRRQWKQNSTTIANWEPIATPTRVRRQWKWDVCWMVGHGRT